MWAENDNAVLRRAAELAAERNGIVTTPLLRAMGLGSTAVSRWVAAGLLHRRYRGVYGFGHSALSLKGEWQAAVDACGRNAFLSHLAAACLWGFLTWDEEWPIDVTVPISSGQRRGKPGIRLHRSSTLTRRDTIERSGIPVTNVSRLISDISRMGAPKLYREACRQAEIKGWRRALPAGHVPNRSDLELRMYALCQRRGLPIPQTRVRIGTYEADFLFEIEGKRVVIETDGWETHGTRTAFEDDREREIELALLGYEVHRFTWRQITERPAWVASSLRKLLGLV